MVNGRGTHALTQFHFHRPGEERVPGRPPPVLGLHLVHAPAPGAGSPVGNGTVVVAALYDLGPPSPALDALLASVAAGHAFDASTLLPRAALDSYYAYAGSLTTPPCSEGVVFYVVKARQTATAAQVAALLPRPEANARPVQARNGRAVFATTP